MSKLETIRKDLNAQVLGQGVAIDLLLTAFIAGEHIALVGPQGEGKTHMADAFGRGIPGNRFYHLLTRFTTPDEVLGGHSMKALLDRDTLIRNVKGKAPEATLVILDEVFKANSPMLNSLLGMMNEREVDGIKCKLETLVGLSNEWPRGIASLARQGDDESLLPLWDRFIIRYEVPRLADDDAFVKIITGQLPNVAIADPLTEADVADLRTKVEVMMSGAPQVVVDAFLELRVALESEGVLISTRRWFKAMRIVCARAILRGSDKPRVSDMMVLKHVLWNTPDERDQVNAIITSIGTAETAFALTVEGDALVKLKELRKMPSVEAEAKRIELTKWMGETIAELERVSARLQADGEDDSEVIRVAALMKSNHAEQTRVILRSIKY